MCAGDLRPRRPLPPKPTKKRCQTNPPIRPGAIENAVFRKKTNPNEPTAPGAAPSRSVGVRRSRICSSAALGWGNWNSTPGATHCLAGHQAPARGNHDIVWDRLSSRSACRTSPLARPALENTGSSARINDPGQLRPFNVDGSGSGSSIGGRRRIDR